MKKFLRINKLYIPVFLVLCSLLLYACVKKDDFDFSRVAELNWNPDLAFPLVNSSLTAKDIITKGDRDGKIEIGTDFFCTLVYKDEIFSKRAEDLVQFPQQNLPDLDYNLTPLAVAAFSVAGTGGAINFNSSAVASFDPGPSNVQVDSVAYKAGQLSVQVSSDVQHDATVQVSFPARKNGAPLQSNSSLNAGNSYSSTSNIDLSGSVFDMTNGGQSNKLPIAINVSFTKGTNANPGTNNKITIRLVLSNLKFQRLHGDVGTLELLSDFDTLDFALFKNSLYTGNIKHADPKLVVDMASSFGVPIEVNFSNVIGKVLGGATFPINGAGVSDPLFINPVPFSQAGTFINAGRTISKANSNIQTVVNSNPDQLIYKLATKSNYSGTPPQRNFMLDSSMVKVNTRMELPLNGVAENFTLEKKFDFEFKESDQVESALIRTFVRNGFPIALNMQIYFTDSNNIILDSLITNTQNNLVVSAAAIDGTGKVTVPSNNTTDNYMEQQRWAKLSTCRYLVLKARVDSAPAATDIKIFSDYLLDVKIAARVKLKADLIK